MNETSGGVQAFTSERAIDLTVKRGIREEYLSKIKENKMEPVNPPRNIMPPYIILSAGFISLQFVMPESYESLPPLAKAIVAGVIVLLAISHEL